MVFYFILFLHNLSKQLYVSKIGVMDAKSIYYIRLSCLWYFHFGFGINLILVQIAVDTLQAIQRKILPVTLFCQVFNVLGCIFTKQSLGADRRRHKKEIA